MTKVLEFVHSGLAASTARAYASDQMFERFTDKARQVVVLAQEEARALNHAYIGTEHLLLGLLREEKGVAARVLASLEITADDVRGRIEQIVGPGTEVVSGQIPFTPRAKKVLELALREALSVGHNYIGTEHILLGLVRDNDGVAARIMLDLGASAERVREEVMNVLGIERGTAEKTRRWRWPRPEVSAIATQRCWQYRVERREAVDEEQLNELGLEGWELFDVYRTPTGVELIFKRRRRDEPGSLRAAG